MRSAPGSSAAHFSPRLSLTLLVTLSVASVQAQEGDAFLEIFERAFPEISFQNPVALAPDPSGSDWLFVVEQAGVIRTFVGDDASDQTHVVLDISDQVVGPDVDVEAGMLGVAPHPGFGQNGYLYVFYIADVAGSWASRISRFSTTGTPAIADPESEVVLLDLDRVGLKHNGGDLHFGLDGYLYASFGDAVCCADPHDNGQDLTNLFSTIIRIDVDDVSGDLPYGIPADNPFVGNTEGWREEIWAYGLRNPWRFSIHSETGELWVGDVGELAYEEINRIVPGGNYGWSVMEGPDCFEWPPGSGQGTDCDHIGILPVWYGDRDIATSITGGYFYRGTRRPDLQGKYVFADWAQRNFFVATPDADVETFEEVEMIHDGGPGDPHPSAFGEDASGELYFFTYFSHGGLYRFVQKDSGTPPQPDPDRISIEVVGPNPFTEQIVLRVVSVDTVVARVDVFDLLGRRVATLHDGGPLPAGEHDLTFSGSGLASGQYIARMSVGGATPQFVRFTRVR